MTVRLRGHHLLCLLTFVGKGYTPAFTANYRRIVGRLNEGAAVEIVDGPDDICAPMLETDHHCLNASVTERDAQALTDVAALLGRPLAANARLVLDAGLLGKLREAFAEGATRRACTRCQWHMLCTDIAGAGYAGVRLSRTDQNTPGMSRAVRAL